MKIHIDLDCFFVSAERTLDPALMGIPVGVGGRGDSDIFSHQNTHQTVSLENHGAFVSTVFTEPKSFNNLNHFVDEDGRVRGILTTSSYEAREYGIKTAMTINEALQRCPHLVIKQPNMKLYQKISYELYEFLSKRIPLLEQGSIDEFYGDLSGWVEDDNIGKFIHELKEEVQEKLNLPLSIGAAQSKYTAKLATTYAKPYGTKVIYPHEVNDFIEDMLISAFPGIGKKTQQKLQDKGLQTLGDIRRAKDLFINQTKSVWELYQKVCGIDTIAIKTKHVRKSIGITRTFDPIKNRAECQRRLTILSRHLAYAVMRMEVIPTTFSLSIAYEMGYRGKANITSNRLFSEKFFKDLVIDLYKQADTYPTLALIRISISTSHFTAQSHRALDLIHFEEDTIQNTLTKKTKLLRDKYGLDALRWGSEI